MAVSPVGTAQQGSSSTASSTFTVTLATGVSVGDLDVIACNVQATGATTATPSGWTVLAAPTDSTGIVMATYYRLHQSGDPTTVAVTITGVTAPYGWVAAAYTGVNQTAPVGTPQTADTTVTATTLNVASLTTTQSGSYRVITAGIGSGSTSFTTMPTGYTEVVQATGGKRVELAHAANASPTTTGALSYTTSASVRGVTTHFELFAAAPGNNPPIANAGPDQTVAANATVTVGGTDTDSDGTIASIAWTQVSGTTVSLSSTSVASPSFTAPGSATTIVLRKTVTDDQGAASFDDVTVTVQAGSGSVAPVGTAQSGYSGAAVSSVTVALATGVSAGAYDVIALTVQGSGVVTATPTGWDLIADATEGSGVDVRTYGRHRQSGDPSSVTVTITGATSSVGWVAAAYGGVHVKTAFGTAQNLATATSQTTIDVAALTTTKVNSYRIIVAGLGSASTAFSGMPTGYSSVAEAAGGKRTVLAQAANPAIGTTAASSFTISVAAHGASSHFELLPASLTNETPVANAGADQSVEPWSTVTLDGTASDDPDGTIASYDWVQLSGGAVVLSGSGATRTFMAPASSSDTSLSFGLVVTDDQGATSAQDTVTITVLAATEYFLSNDGTWTPMRTTSL